MKKAKNNKVLGLIRRRLNRVITKFETACGHEARVDEACNALENLMDFIAATLASKDAEIEVLRNSKP